MVTSWLRIESYQVMVCPAAAPVPRADRGHGLSTAIARGPAAISIHVVVGLLLVLAAIGLLVQAVLARMSAVIAASALALLAIGGAAFTGTDFVSTGRPAASMAMAVLTGVAMLCHAGIVYLLGVPRPSAS